jgi:mitochondrial fission protein ELM1
MTAPAMRAQLQKFFDATPNMARWVTTSRRTPPDVEAIVREMPFDYRLIFSEDQFNPIPAFVMLCDTLCVTSDSTGMISEAVTRGAARVEILMNLRKRGTKFERFIRDLETAGCVHCFDNTLGDARKKIDLLPIMRQVAEKAGLVPHP